MVDKMLSPKEVAEVLGKSEQIVRRFIRQGRIKAVKIGRTWRVDPDVVALIKREGMK
jgi:excisionase family DNA binding protein